MRLFLLFVGLLVLSSQLQHLHASRHYSSPLPSNPASNHQQINVQQGNMVSDDTQIQRKDVTVASKLGGGSFRGSFRSGGGSFRGGGGGFSSRGGGFSSRGSGSYYRSRGSGLPAFGAGFGVGYIFGHGHHHHSGGASSVCSNPCFQILATIIVLAKFILSN